MSDSDAVIDPAAAFQALQQFTANEVARLYGEIALRDTFIAQLQEHLRPDVPSEQDVEVDPGI